ncbi:class I SAM-dependent methyltransferase [bacterium D16-51]|nr:class I SAM-dependent methyltransferase [bacterium D16-59]RKI54787.1 class I SAM-dependent methyltransferase [bacterium D16-51]
MKRDNIKQAYKCSQNIYDEVLTQNKMWAKIYNRLFWNVDDNLIAKKVLDVIPHDFSGEILDVPVGTAVFTVKKYVSLPLAQITCLDYSEDMLLQAQNRFNDYHIPNARCIQGDVGKLPFMDKKFDILLSMNGFHAFPDKEKAFTETYRVLKDGGLFTGCFYIKGECRRTDFLINNFLAPKGWFSPPFYSFLELKHILEKLYSNIKISNYHAIAYFKCKK